VETDKSNNDRPLQDVFYAVVFQISFAGGYTVVYFLCDFLTGATDTQRRPHLLG
jgi:hypothetical protein